MARLVMAESSDNWEASARYEDYMGRWSRLLAPRFVSWLSVPPGAHWLDVGCGTGALSEAVCTGARPASVVGCDPSLPFVEYARRRLVDPHVSFDLSGVENLPTRPGKFDSVASLLALNFFRDPQAALASMLRVAATGGVVSACVWDYAGRMQYLRCFWDSAVHVGADAVELDEGRRFPICRREALESLFRGGGLGDVVCDAIEIPIRFATFAELWQPFLGGTGPAPGYVATLDRDRREVLASHFERSLPRDPDGAISLVGRAWAVRGVTRSPN